MLINGEKWACETCIKGHRATHCKHSDRVLVPIKKKGRPSTQCKRCRELRIVRQLHVRCDCEDQGNRITKKSVQANSLKKKVKMDILRPIAPKRDINSPILDSPFSSHTPSPPLMHAIQPMPKSKTTSGCCGNGNKDAPLVTPKQQQTTVSSCCPSKSVPLPNIPPPSSCCGPPTKNQQGEMIRVVTCRCGDSCACIGCDAHPSRAMKEGRDDVYIGFDEKANQRRLSIAAITSISRAKTMIQAGTEIEYPSSILTQDGIVLCGCGCQNTFQDCHNCFQELCHDFI